MSSMPSGNAAFDFEFKSLKGEALPLGQFAGRPMLIVNTASKCGFTPQYAGLEALWQRHRAAGLVVLGVPSNDFANQEPGDSGEIASFCAINYGVDFPMTAKVHVRGPEAHPLFRWLAAEGGFLARPRWNFYKYAIGRDGRLASWFSSLTKPDAPKLDRAVEALLGGV
jgi:glutathione peroxidase